jgi:hypothetical protein
MLFRGNIKYLLPIAIRMSLSSSRKERWKCIGIKLRSRSENWGKVMRTMKLKETKKKCFRMRYKGDNWQKY